MGIIYESNRTGRTLERAKPITRISLSDSHVEVARQIFGLAAPLDIADGRRARDSVLDDEHTQRDRDDGENPFRLEVHSEP